MALIAAKIHRRSVLGGAALLLPTPLWAADGAAAITALEKARGLKIGLAALDTGSGRTLMHRQNERFVMCSTFKMMLSAAVLARVDRGQERLDRVIHYKPSDLLDYAPAAKKNIATGMSIEKLCEAAVELSDNTCANLLFNVIGGPPALQSFVRGLGDMETRHDRIEGALNVPDGDKDTTKPATMIQSMRKVLLGDVLKPGFRAHLSQWMRDCSTGKERIRSGIPKDWQVGDKPGSAFDMLNDIAILCPPGNRKPILVCCYTTGNKKDDKATPGTWAEIGKIIAKTFA